jgi:hypothetical protein
MVLAIKRSMGGNEVHLGCPATSALFDQLDVGIKVALFHID